MRDIDIWLRGLGLEQYAEAFRKGAIEADVVPDLTEGDLKELDIPLGHRRKLLKAIEALRTEPRTPEGAIAEAAPTSGAPNERSPTAPAERRQLTVMFVDLVGSTELSLKLDPEDLRELIRAYQNALGGEVARYGGHVAKYMGDGVLVYFGYPQAHEDDAVRAVYGGLAVTRAVKRLGKRALKAHGGRLRARVGIATGLVVVGDLVGAEGSEAGAVTGETPNLAYRLQEAAGSGRVAVAERTHVLAGNAFAYEDAEERRLKGFPEPVRLWRVLGPSGAESRFEALHGRWLTPLVGREHELALLMDRWDQAKEGEGQVVLVSGEPGIGKSRITEVLRERIMADEHVRIRLQCSPYHTNSALHPVIEHLERAAGFEHDEGPEAKLAKLEAMIGQATTTVAETAPLLAALLGVPTGDRYPPLAMSPERQKERTLAALSDQVVGLAVAKPLLMIVEDAHWIDPTTLESIDLTIARAETQRLLIVVTYRPEFHAKWVGRPNVTLITMNRLSKRQGATMVEGIAGGRALPSEILDQLVAKTDGVPLFVEELTRMVLESGLLREEAGRYVLDGPLPPLAIPATLHDSLMARLDRLAPAKEVAQTAAAIGRTFSHELLAAVVALEAPKLDAALGQLVVSGLVFRQGQGPEASYTFKHALVQDAAYASMLRSQRQSIHARIADTLTKQFPDTARTAPELVANHYAEAGLTDRALPLWIAATAQAAGRSANVEAIAHARRGLGGLESLPAGSVRDRIELELLTLLGPALLIVDGYVAPSTVEAYDRAAVLIERVNDPTPRFRTLYGRMLILSIRADHRKALDLALQLTEAAQEAGDEELKLQAYRVVGASSFFRGLAPEVLRAAEQASALYDPVRHRAIASRYGFDPLAIVRGYAGNALWLLGYPERAARESAHAEEIALATEHTHSIAMVRAHRVWQRVMARDWGGTIAAAPRVIDFAALHGTQMWRHFSRMHLGMARFHLGDTDGLREAESGFAEWEAQGNVITGTFSHVMLAEARASVGDWDEGFRRLDLAFDLAEKGGEHFWLPELHRQRGLLLLKSGRGDLAEAEAALRAALEAARERQLRSLELRAATSLAGLWAERGDRQRALDLLAPIYGWFTEGFETRDLIEAKALLDELD